MTHTPSEPGPYSVKALPPHPFQVDSPASGSGSSSAFSFKGATRPPHPLYYSFSSFFFRRGDVLQHSSSSYSRVFLLLTSTSFVFAIACAISIRLSCDPAVLVASGTIGRRWTGIAVWPRFIVQSLRVLSPVHHAFAALLYSYALAFRRRTGSERDGQLASRHQSAATIDFSTLSGCQQFAVEVGRDTKDAAERLWQYFFQPTSTPSAAATRPVNGLSESLLDAAPSHDVSAMSVVVRSRLTSAVVSVLYFCRRLLASPFYFLRWYLTPLSFRSVYYRLTVRALITAALHSVPVNIERAYGAHVYFDRIGYWLYELGLRADIAGGIIDGWVSFFLYHQTLVQWLDLLLLVVWCRASKVEVKPEEITIRGKQQRIRRQLSGLVDIGEADEEEAEAEEELNEQQQDNNHSSQQQQQLEEEPAGDAEAKEEVQAADDPARVSLSSRLQSWFWSAVERRPSILWMWAAFYLSALLLPALFNMLVTVEWSGALTSKYYYWFDSRHKFVLYASLFPCLVIEHCLHVRGAEHARAWPESTTSWFKQSHAAEHSHSHSDSDSDSIDQSRQHDPCHACRPMCSCHLVRLFVLAVVASWCFNDMLAMLMNQYGAVTGDTSVWSYYDITWRVMYFYATTMMWKLAVRWVALGALPGVTSVVPVFAIQLVEDVWSFLFFTSCEPFSGAFFIVCGLHFVKTLGRDLNAPFWAACFVADRLNRYVKRSDTVSSSPISCMPSPGWRVTRKRSMMRHQNFLAFTCAKLIVLACFVADLLPGSMGSYGVSPKLSQAQRVGKIVAIAFVVTQQALSHWTVLQLIAWLSKREREAATAAKEQDASTQQPKTTVAIQGRVITVLVDEEKDFDTRLPRPLAMSSPITPKRRRALHTLSQFVDVHWRYHFLFFAVSVCRVALETTRFATAAAHMPAAAYPDNKCIST